jgi:hypothetical protein
VISTVRIIPSERLAFFLGAGASVEFAVPTMKKMTKEFSERICEEDLFININEILLEIYGKGKVYLEAIMSVISGLKEGEHFRENIGELGAFFLTQQGIENSK